MKMTLFDYTGDIEFASDLSLDAALRRLTEIMSDPNYDPTESGLWRSHLRGHVSQKEVVLHRVRPLIGNYFYKPIFYGKFVQRDNGKIALEGVFSMSTFAKGAFVISTVLLILLECLFVISSFRTAAPLLHRIVFVLFLPTAGLLIVGAHLFLKRLFRKDVGWISNSVKSALRSKEGTAINSFIG